MSRDFAHFRAIFVSAELLHQIQTEIDQSINAAAAEHAVIFRHELFESEHEY
jgi:hypothetical protein